ncbi:MAG: DUF1598 domain-containing protein [Planctomycetota bacterium]|nr:DUF1598 domain-containing protein [Planctomycetota bacterium]
MILRRISVSGLLFLVIGLSATTLPAQNTTTTTTTSSVAGVEVDAGGVLRFHMFVDRTGKLAGSSIAAARRSLPADIAKSSDLRKVSLNRLEAAVAARIAAGETPTEAMLYLAGLQRIQYVFVYPETGDIVVAGPAEGWASDLSGRVRGITSGAPVIELQDLIVALRAFPPGGSETPVIRCSIDPTQEGLANMQQFLVRLGGRATPDQTRFIVDGLRKSLGLQNITIGGIPADTHFAKILVEADYRMKLIGIGLERTSVKKMKSYVELASPASIAKNAMQRWYFVPDYECVRVSEDELAMELVGNAVKLIGADEMVAADGTRVNAAQVNMASKRFVDGFTEKYPELAKAVPVYAQLRNLIDMSVAAAYIQRQDFYGQVGWSMDLFGNEQAYSVQTGNAPQQVEAAVSAFWRGNHLTTPIGGGVNIQPRLALTSASLLPDEQGAVKKQRGEITLDHLKPGQWWWD